MKKHRIMVSILFLILFAVSACAKDQSESISYDLESLDVEKTSHVQLTLTDQVEVNADVTPYEDYKDGVSAYYLEAYENEVASEEEAWGETGADDSELNLYAVTIDGIPMEVEDESEAASAAESETEFETSQGVDEITDFLSTDSDTYIHMIDEYFGCTLDASLQRITWNGLSYTQEIPDEEGNHLVISSNCTALGKLYYPDGDTLSIWRSATVKALRYTRKVSDCLLENAEDEVQKNYAEGRTLIEELTGRELSDYGVCLPLDDEDVDYTFYYFYELDGIPILSDFLSFTADKKSAGSIYNQRSGYSRVYYETDQITGVDVKAGISVGAVYRDSQDIIDVKGVLTIAQEYYYTRALTRSITISDIRLVYNTYYSSEESEDKDNVILPFWYLVYFDATADCANQVLVIQAYTGEVLGTTNYIYDVDE